MKLKIIIVSCCLVLFFLGCGFSAYNKNLKKGKESFERENYIEAVKYFSLAITINPEKEEVYLLRAETFFCLEQYEKTIKDCNFFLDRETDVQQKQAYLLRGKAYFKLAEYKRALKDYNAVAALDYAYAPTYRLRGLLFLKIEAFKRAKSDLKYAIDLDPTDLESLLYLANYYVVKKQYKTSLPYLEKAVVLDANSAMAHYLMGKAYLGLNNTALAFEKCAVVNNLNSFLGEKLRKQYIRQKDSIWEKRRF